MKRKKLVNQPLRTILSSLVGMACGLTALSASATIVGSSHDLRGILPTVDNTTGEICVVCHTPHDANGNDNGGTVNGGTPITEAPLWNRTSSAVTTYTMYANMTGTIDGVEDTQPTGASRLCLSCHDGTVAYDEYGGGANSGVGMMDSANDFYVGTDLRGQHPISLTYDNTADPGLHLPSNTVIIGGFDNGTVTLPQRSGTIADLMLPGGKVQCSSCHDVHNTFVATANAMLRVSMQASQLCLTCHNK